MRIITLALVAFFVLSYSGQAAEDKADKLIGKWAITKGEFAGYTMEFFKGCKVKMSLKKGDKTAMLEGTYKFEGDTLEITKGHTDSSRVKLLTDEKLVLDRGETELVFKKVKAKK